MKFSKGFPFYDPPWRQPITRKEQGHWFAPVEKVDLNTTQADIVAQTEKTRKALKIIKIILIILGVAVFLALGYYFYKDNLELDLKEFKIYLH